MRQQTKPHCDFSCFTTPQEMTMPISAVLLACSTSLFSVLTSESVALLSLRAARDTPTHKSRPRLLSQPQQLSQHTSVSSDLSVRERAFQSSSSQINVQAFEAHR